MSLEAIKLFTPVLIFAAWIFFALRVRTLQVIFAGLFFASYAGCSSNFNFAYRQLHQIIQILLICLLIILIIRTYRILKINLVFIIMLLFIGISLINAPLSGDAKPQLINLLVSIGVVNYLFTALRTDKDIDKVLRFLAQISVLLAFIGLAEFVLNPLGRIKVTFSNPNYYGLFLGIGFCIVFVNWQGWKRNAALILIMCAIIMSRSGSVLIFPLMQIFLDSLAHKNTRKYITLAIILLLSVLIIFQQHIKHSVNKIYTKSSYVERVIYARIALRMANNNPLTGVGWGRFIEEFNGYSISEEKVLTAREEIDISDQDRRVTHNDYLRILAELGWIAFVMSIVLSIRGIKILIRQNGFGLDYILPIWIGLIFFSVCHNNMNTAFFWFFFMLPFFLNSIRKNQIGGAK